MKSTNSVQIYTNEIISNGSSFSPRYTIGQENVEDIEIIDWDTNHVAVHFVGGEQTIEYVGLPFALVKVKKQ